MSENIMPSMASHRSATSGAHPPNGEHSTNGSPKGRPPPATIPGLGPEPPSALPTPHLDKVILTHGREGEAALEIDRLDFVENAHQHVLENLKSADARAALLLVLQGVLLYEVYLAVDRNPRGSWAFGLAAPFLVIAMSKAVGVVWPSGALGSRSWKGVSSSLLGMELSRELPGEYDPDRIVHHFTRAKFVEEFHHRTPHDLVNQVLGLVFKRTVLYREKYLKLRTSFAYTAVGVILVAVAAVGSVAASRNLLGMFR